MTAYRLHFEEANLKLLELIKKGKIGDPKFIQAIFSFQIKNDNIRLKSDLGGGTVYDLGIYCINAARHIFQSEPQAVFAFSRNGEDPRFEEVDETTSAILKFPGGRLATFTSSFAAADNSICQITGSTGSICLEPAFDYSIPLELSYTKNGNTINKKFKKVDQFAGELEYFSNCIINNIQPEPSGLEGLADVRVIEAIYRSAASEAPVYLDYFEKNSHPHSSQKQRKPASRETRLIKAEKPFEDEENQSNPRLSLG